MTGRRMDAGTKVFDDHRDNLTVDVLNDLLQERAEQMRSEDSQTAMLWNVFRSLQKLDPQIWLKRMLRHACPESRRILPLLRRQSLRDATFHWWVRYDLPETRHAWLTDAARNANLHLDHYPARYLREKKAEVRRRLESELPMEDPVEIPLCIETKGWMLGVLAVYKGNLRQNSRYDSRRDDVLRMLDAGSHHAAKKNKKFLSLVIYTDSRTYNTETKALVDRYSNRAEQVVARLPHREDHENLVVASQLLCSMRWRELGAVLVDAKQEERVGLFDEAVLDELIKYLARKEINFNFFRRLK